MCKMCKKFRIKAVWCQHLKNKVKLIFCPGLDVKNTKIERKERNKKGLKKKEMKNKKERKKEGKKERNANERKKKREKKTIEKRKKKTVWELKE